MYLRVTKNWDLALLFIRVVLVRSIGPHIHKKREGENIVGALLSLPVRFCVHFRHWIHSVYWKSRNFSENFAY